MSGEREVARYIIVLDRLDPSDDWAKSAVGPDDGHDGSAKAACEQVAAELQEAMNTTGSPAGFFNVIDRRKIPMEERVANSKPPDELAAQIGLERKMEDDD